MIIPLVGMGISQGVFPPLAHLLISTLDWRRTWTVLDLVVWGLLVVPSFFLVRRSPESVGTVPDGKVQDSASQQGRPPTSAGSSFTSDWSLKQLWRLRSFWLLLFVASASSLVQTGLVFHQVSILGERGIDSGVAAAALGMIAPAYLAGAVGTGFLADALPNRFIMIGTNGLIAAGLASYLTLSSDEQAIANGLVIGLASGSHMIEDGDQGLVGQQVVALVGEEVAQAAGGEGPQQPRHISASRLVSLQVLVEVPEAGALPGLGVVARQGVVEGGPPLRAQPLPHHHLDEPSQAADALEQLLGVPLVDDKGVHPLAGNAGGQHPAKGARVSLIYWTSTYP